MSYKTIDIQTGSGSLYSSDQYICNGLYTLAARQEMVTSSSWRDAQVIPGQVEISGEIVVSLDDRFNSEVLQKMESAAILTLRLEKPFFGGRSELRVHANRHGVTPVNGIYHLQAVPQE